MSKRGKRSQLRTMGHRGVSIPPDQADLQILVGDDGVWLGFFGSDGQIAMLNIDTLPVVATGLARGEALRAWADDRRAQVILPG